MRANAGLCGRGDHPTDRPSDGHRLHTSWLDTSLPRQRTNPGCSNRSLRANQGSTLGFQLCQRRVDLALLVLQMGDLVLDLLRAEPELGGRGKGALALRQHVADLDQGEAELLALQDNGQAGPVAGIVN